MTSRRNGTAYSDPMLADMRIINSLSWLISNMNWFTLRLLARTKKRQKNESISV